MYRKQITATAAAAVAIVLATGAQGGCGSTGAKPSGGGTKVQIQGDPANSHKCKLELVQHLPVDKLLTATLTVTCNFPLASAYTTLVIQGRPVGGDDTQWDNLGDPQPSSETTHITLTFRIPCITALEYQSSASIDASGADGTPVHADQTTTPRSYSASQCTQGK
jgi:hypothetical protein